MHSPLSLPLSPSLSKRSVLCSYEDTVGGVPADVVIFFRPADAATDSASAATIQSTGGAAEDAPPDGAAGEGANVGGAGGGKGEAVAVLTVVVRPLPSTAPASVDSGSSRGGGEMRVRSNRRCQRLFGV